MSDTRVYRTQGGNTFQVGPGGIINVQDGGQIIIEPGGELGLTDGAVFVLPAGTITTADIASHAVTFAKADTFLSAIETGTGSPQDIAHGLGVVPAAVLIVPVNTTPSTQVWDVTYGTNTTTNIVVTVTADATFLAFAWA